MAFESLQAVGMQAASSPIKPTCTAESLIAELCLDRAVHRQIQATLIMMADLSVHDRNRVVAARVDEKLACPKIYHAGRPLSFSGGFFQQFLLIWPHFQKGHQKKAERSASVIAA